MKSKNGQRMCKVEALFLVQSILVFFPGYGRNVLERRNTGNERMSKTPAKSW